MDSSADPNYFPELEPLSAISAHKEFSTYSTWRRTRALRALPPNFVGLGPLAYLLENPLALLAGLCFLASAATFALGASFALHLPRTRISLKGFTVPAAWKREGA